MADTYKAYYSQGRRTFTIVDFGSGKQVFSTSECHSGNDNPADETKQNVGPLPRGTYRTGGITGGTFGLTPRRVELIRQDRSVAPNRDGFKIHEVGTGATIGCISSNAATKAVIDLIDSGSKPLNLDVIAN